MLGLGQPAVGFAPPPIVAAVLPVPAVRIRGILAGTSFSLMCQGPLWRSVLIACCIEVEHAFRRTWWGSAACSRRGGLRFCRITSPSWD